MDSIGYAALARQSGLAEEMRSVANNIANASTTGFRKEGVIFAEHVYALQPSEPSLSTASGEARRTDGRQGPISQTGGTFDLAIQGEGFFLIDTPQGQQITRAGSFTPNGEGTLVTPDGYPLLDAGGAPIFVPPDAKAIAVAADGTLSVDGQPTTQIGLYMPSDPLTITRKEGVRFSTGAGVIPAEEATMLQGFLEGSNVSPVSEIARMIEVQRAYELGQTFAEKEDERIRSVLQALGR